MQKNFFTCALVTCALVSLSLLSGCASFPTQKTSGGALQQAPLLKFEDVPVPLGFSLLGNESFSFQTDVTRVGLLKYAGRPLADQVVYFYKEQMPQYGWSLLNVVEYGKRILNFDREGQTCIVTVEPAATKTIITISVAPKSKGIRPPAAEKTGEHATK